MDRAKLVVVMPALNEEAGVGSTIDELKTTLHNYDFHIVVVDGHSKDKTVEIAKKSGATVVYQRRPGYGGALNTGFLYGLLKLDASIFLALDADGSYSIKDTPKLIDCILRGEADYVTGKRVPETKEAMNYPNKFGNWVISWMTRSLLRIPLHDSQTGMFAFRTSLIRGTNLKTQGWAINTELLKRAVEMDMVIQEIPVTYRNRLGKTKLGIIKGGLANLAVLLRMMRDAEPMLLFGTFAGVFVLIGILAGTGVAIEWLTTGTEKHIMTAILSAMSVMVGIQLLAIGLLADMIRSRTTYEKKDMQFEVA